jgi:Alpha amylase, catalytic domain
MSEWPVYPVLYEINTWVWLDEMSRAQGRRVTLASVRDREWDALGALNFDAVWLMGVWERSPAGKAIANANAALIAEFQRVLPDYRTEDNVGSPYCVRRYVVDPHLGGREGLEIARAALARRGMRLVLDFVPNHVAPDHPWALEHPEFFVGGSADDLARDPASFVKVGDHVFARGRDPYFPAWPDVLQLNAFAAQTRAAAAATVSEIACQCDAVRCDMAMLMLNTVFERTWGSRVGRAPQPDYWRELIATVEATHREFGFLAEAYWDLEWELQQQGFAYCYDKRLYDRLEHDTAESIRLHLCADLAYQSKLVRFLENHDEPRAAATFTPEKERAAAVIAFTLPGARLLHEGQLEGRKVKLPVFLGRRPLEPLSEPLRDFYSRLLVAIGEKVFRDGEWQSCERSGWPDNRSYLSLLAWCWRLGPIRHVIVVNLSDSRSQGKVRLPWEDLALRTWRLEDALSGATFDRNGDQMCGAGLYVDLPPWAFHFMQLRATQLVSTSNYLGNSNVKVARSPQSGPPLGVSK